MKATAESLAPRFREAVEDTFVFRGNTDSEMVERELEVFYSSVSHDLREPLCAIVGLSRLLVDLCSQSLEPEALSILERITRTGLAMEGLLNAHLDLARANGMVVRTEPVNLSAKALGAFRSRFERFPDRDVTVVVRDDIWASGDPALLELVMDNLVGNAWKFTSTRASAHIEFGRRDEGEEVVYFVRDDGPGFDPAKASDLFRPFHRLDRTLEGFGVGLAVVDRVVRRHGGRAWAEGRLGDGATFCFTLRPQHALKAAQGSRSERACRAALRPAKHPSCEARLSAGTARSSPIRASSRAAS